MAVFVPFAGLAIWPAVAAFAAPAAEQAAPTSIESGAAESEVSGTPLKLEEQLSTSPVDGDAEGTAGQSIGGASADVDAQMVPSSVTLETLPAIMAKVWRENPQVRQAEQALEASGYDITAARAGYLPYLQVQSAVADKSDDSISTLYVVLPIWSGGATNAAVDVAKARQKAALADLTRTRLELGQRTLDAYFNVVQAQDQVIQWNNYIGALKRLLATIDRRATQGLAPQADVDTAVSRLRQAQASLEATKATVQSNRAQLISLLNASPGSLSWPEDSAILPQDDIDATKDRIRLHPTHLAAEAEVAIQKGTARSAKAALWPELSIQHRRQLEGVEFDPSNDATLLVATFQSNNGVQGLFNSKAEQQRLEAMQARLVAADRDVSATLLVDKTQLVASAAQLEVQYEAVQSQTALVESFLRQFEAGRKSWLDVLNAQREANDVVLQSIQVRRNYWYANSKLTLDGMYWDRYGAEMVDDSGEAIGK